MHHRRQKVITYTKMLSNNAKLNACHFCGIGEREKVIAENATMVVVVNRVAYDIFEDRKVADHLLVIPKKHHDSISTFSDQEKLDYMALTGDYEARDYCVYARGARAATRSVRHQHTHLIKLTGAPLKMVFYSRKPYILINK